MGFGLSKTASAQRDKYVENLRLLEEELVNAVEAYNDAMTTERSNVEAALQAYNDAYNEAHEWADQIANSSDDDYNDKSEKWQEGDKGIAARDWIDEWLGFHTGEASVEWPDDLTVDNTSAADDLEALPEEASE